MICDKAQDSFATLLDLPLGKANELDVIILKPLGVFLAERLAIDLLVIFYKLTDESQETAANGFVFELDFLDFPRSVCGVAGIGRIAKDD